MIKQIKMLDGTTKYFEETGLQEVLKPKGKWVRPNINSFKEYKHIANMHAFTIEENKHFETIEECTRYTEIWEYIYNNNKVFTMEEWADEDIFKYYISAWMGEFNLEVLYAKKQQTGLHYFESTETARKVADFIGFDDWCKYVANIYYENE